MLSYAQIKLPLKMVIMLKIYDKSWYTTKINLGCDMGDKFSEQLHLLNIIYSKVFSLVAHLLIAIYFYSPRST